MSRIEIKRSMIISYWIIIAWFSVNETGQTVWIQDGELLIRMFNSDSKIDSAADNKVNKGWIKEYFKSKGFCALVAGWLCF